MLSWLGFELPEWWTGWHTVLLSVAVAVPMAVASAFVVGYFLARLPADYFVNPAARRPDPRHPVLHVLFVLGKNLLGYALIALGVALSLPGVPGQGLLTILMGVMLIDFPGKHRFEEWLLSRRAVLRQVNRFRARAGRPPILTNGERPG